MEKHKIGITWGVFDGLHKGHINLLREAKKDCKCLIVCISDDEYLKKHKNTKPLIPFEHRFEALNACRYVDLVDVQTDERTKKDAVKQYKPNIVFVGSDWQYKEWDGKTLGLPIKYIPYTEGISSTILRENARHI